MKENNNIATWLNENGQPNFDYLQALAQEGTVESLEQLKLIADDVNADYQENISALELVERIRLSLSQEDSV